MWIEKAAGEKTVVGHTVQALHPDALSYAVGKLAEVPGAATHLKVRAGEHLAALLLTAVCGPPSQIDTDGGVDLVFERERMPAHFTWEFGEHDRADFEVKSFAGTFRHAESRMQLGDSHSILVRSALDVLTAATELLERAVRALAEKSAPQTSKNVFLIIHPFDAITVEAFDDPVAVSTRLGPTMTG